jgi:hypothetical protein
MSRGASAPRRLGLSASLWLAACSGGRIDVVVSDTAPPASAPPVDPTVDSGGLDSAAPEPPRVLDALHQLVVPHDDGLTLYDDSFAEERVWTWEALVPACAGGCFGEGGSADGDGLLTTWVADGVDFRGGVSIVGGTGRESATGAGLSFPHDVVRDPLEGTLIVCEAHGDVSWVAADGSSLDAIRRLGVGTPGWESSIPNSLDLVVDGGRALLLVTVRGDPFTWGPTGLIMAWDVTEPDLPALVWRFPETGSLDTPHGAVLREHGGQWWLLYAHTRGMGEEAGTVGVAVLETPWSTPTYAADLVPPVLTEPWSFLRGVDLGEDGTLILTDSGVEFVQAGPPSGRVIAAALPSLAPSGQRGGTGDQHFVPLDGAEARLSGLAMPFEGWIRRRPTR